jgi:hypothetical protein
MPIAESFFGGEICVTKGKRYLHEGSESALLTAGCRRKKHMLMAACKIPTTIVVLYSNTSRRSIFDDRLNFGIDKGDVIAFEFVSLKVIE